MKIIVTGATGLAREELVRHAIADDNINGITAIVRKPIKFQSP